MSGLELKPRFELNSPKSCEELTQLLKQHISTQEKEVHGRVLRDHATIILPIQDQKVWSPQLNIEIIEKNGVSLIKGHFAPHPNIWLFHMFIYMICCFVAIFGLTIGFSQWSMQKPMYGFYTALASSIVALFFYLSAQYGQKKAKYQMHDLMRFLLQALQLEKVEGVRKKE